MKITLVSLDIYSATRTRRFQVFMQILKAANRRLALYKSVLVKQFTKHTLGTI